MSVHLFVKSSYTLLESTIRIPELVKKAKEYGYKSVALTDHNVMFGTASFLHACASEGIRPIIGMEADFLYHDMTVPFLLLAKDNHGYSDLMTLSSYLNDGHDQAPIEVMDDLAKHCFIIAYGEGGWMDKELVAGEMDACKEKLTLMKQELPVFDIALSYMDAALWKMRNTQLKQLCRNLGIHTAALNKISYLNQKDSEACRILNGIRTVRNINDSSLLIPSGRYFLDQKEMEALYEADDLERTEAIAAECSADGILAKTSLPQFHVKQEGVSSADYLKALCAAGLKKRMDQHVPKEYQDRLKYELSVILKMHFEDYFLIVYDFIRYARKKGINVGPGRGSAVGSLVAYSLGITMIDPMKYHLLFERFLNPDRVSMPDIDTDIPDNRRDEVIQYVYETYGADHIANIVTFGTLGAKQVIRDVGKVMNVNGRDLDLIARQIPNQPKMTLAAAYQMSPRLKQIIESNDSFKKFFAMCMKLEGLPRHTSTHAAGIIMSSRSLNEVIPTIRLGEDMKTSQYTMEYLEERGLIKMDFLGLRNLTIIDEIVKDIQKDEPAFSLNHIPMNDPSVYQIFAKADTVGIFQFESEGLKALLRKIKPTCFEDIVAANALYRPGPMENIPAYLANRADPSHIKYPSKQLEEILHETYGVMIYQEQIMLVAQAAGGFSLAKADILRRAMSKKKEKEIAGLQQEFIEGCLKNHYTKETAEHLYSLIAKFAGYGFNKSHSVAYSVIAYQMAYLKSAYPIYFYRALLDSVIGDENRTSQYIDECRRRSIKVLYPSVNASSSRYSEKDHAVILPLSAVKNVGTHIGDTLVEEREAHGPYQDFFDFTARAVVHKIKRDALEALIDAGALDCFQMGRSTCRRALDDALRYAELVQIHEQDQITINLGLVTKPDYVRIKDDEVEKSERERAALGFNLGPHPIIQMRKANNIQDLSLAVLKDKRGVWNGFALIASVHTHRTKRGDMMAFVKLSDETGDADMAVMPQLYQKISPILMKGTYIRFNVKIQDERSFLANEVQVIRKK